MNHHCTSAIGVDDKWDDLYCSNTLTHIHKYTVIVTILVLYLDHCIAPDVEWQLLMFVPLNDSFE